MENDYEFIENLSEEKFEEILSILCSLAKRKNPNLKWWSHTNYVSHILICNICNHHICDQNVNGDIETIKLYNHMVFHLRERNLMVLL
jgi:hypothetical protein